MSQILHQGTTYQQAAIHLSEEIKFGDSHQYSLSPGYYIRTGDSLDSETYAPADGPDAGRVKTAPGSITLQGSFIYSNDDKTIGVITNFYQAVNAEAKGITRTTRPVLSTEIDSAIAGLRRQDGHENPTRLSRGLEEYHQAVERCLC